MLQDYFCFIVRYFHRFSYTKMQTYFSAVLFTQNKDGCVVEVLVPNFFTIMIRQAAKWKENMVVEKSRLSNKL